MRFWLALTTWLLLAAVSLGSEYHYESSTGLYYRDGTAYTRYDAGYWWKSYYTAYTYSACGCYKYPYQAYEWKWHTDYRYTPYKLPDYKDPNWRAKLLDIAAARDKVEGKIRLNEQEQEAYLSSINALGLTGNFHWSGYGLNPYRAMGQYGVQGNTQYGYTNTYKAVAEAYGPVDLNILGQQAFRLAEQSNGYANEQSLGFQSLVNQFGFHQARVAEIRAKGDVLAAVLKGDPVTRVTVQGTVKGYGPKAEPRIQPAQVEFLKLSGPAKCIKCHSGETIKGNFDITKYDPRTADDNTLEMVAKYISGRDLNKRHCPPGERLSAAEMGQILGGDIQPAPMPAAKE